MKRTAILIHPSLEEVELAASKIGLPPIEAEKFFHYYESNGWRVGRVKMVSFAHALAGWKLRWMERSGQKGQRGYNGDVKKHWAELELEQMGRKLERE